MKIQEIRQFKDCGGYCVSWGGGLDSSAILAQMVINGFRPDGIVFAETGHEWPETYDAIEQISDFLVAKGFPVPARVARKDVISVQRIEDLGGECLRSHTLPSVAYGWHKCSIKSKADVINAHWKQQPWVQQIWAKGLRIVKCIGYDVNENRRAKDRFGDPKEQALYEPYYPLRDWGFDRDACAEVCQHVFGFAPKKSACVFCPHAHDHEWLDLQQKHPHLMELCLAIEALALPNVRKPDVAGLRRRGKRGERQLVDWFRNQGWELPETTQAILTANLEGDNPKRIPRVEASTGIEVTYHDGVTRVWYGAEAQHIREARRKVKKPRKAG